MKHFRLINGVTSLKSSANAIRYTLFFTRVLLHQEKVSNQVLSKDIAPRTVLGPLFSRPAISNAAPELFFLEPSDHLCCMLVWRENGIEDMLDACVLDDEGEAFQ